jgi:hypothetical protein
MKSKQFPSWFYPHSPPVKPVEPSKTLKKSVVLDHIGNYDSIKVADLPDGTEEIHVDADCDHDQSYYSEGIRVKVSFIRYDEVENTRYKHQLSQYKKDIKLYEERSIQWKELKKQWNEKQKEDKTKSKEAEERRERKMLAELKKKYEKEIK